LLHHEYVKHDINNIQKRIYHDATCIIPRIISKLDQVLDNRKSYNGIKFPRKVIKLLQIPRFLTIFLMAVIHLMLSTQTFCCRRQLTAVLGIPRVPYCANKIECLLYEVKRKCCFFTIRSDIINMKVKAAARLTAQTI
jgi:hypothetical protein